MVSAQQKKNLQLYDCIIVCQLLMSIQKQPQLNIKGLNPRDMCIGLQHSEENAVKLASHGV